MHDLIIIGAGPAGITAGIYAARQKLNVLIIAKEFGGLMAKKAIEIENYPGFEKISRDDLMKKFEVQLKALNVPIETGEVRKIEKKGDSFLISTAAKKDFEAKAVIVASGSCPRPLKAKGEKEFIGKGVSYCAVCDGPIFRDKTVAIVGGGNAGFETAIFLSNYVKKIYILEYGPEVKADEENKKLVEKTGKAEIITNAAAREIKGENFVSAIVYEDLKSKKEVSLNVEGVFVEIGYQPATSFVKGIVDFNENDEIMVDPEACQTKTPGLFAAGDVNAGRYKQIVTAAGEGAKAALAAYEYLKSKN